MEVVNSSQLTLQCDDFAGRIHNGRVGADGTANGIGRVAHVDDHHLVSPVHLLADADELVRLHGERAERNRVRIDPGSRKLRGEDGDGEREEEKRRVAINDKSNSVGQTRNNIRRNKDKSDEC